MDIRHEILHSISWTRTLQRISKSVLTSWSNSVLYWRFLWCKIDIKTSRFIFTRNWYIILEFYKTIWFRWNSKTIFFRIHLVRSFKACVKISKCLTFSKWRSNWNQSSYISFRMYNVVKYDIKDRITTCINRTRSCSRRRRKFRFISKLDARNEEDLRAESDRLKWWVTS